MDNKFLNKVVDQIVSETRIDYDEERFLPPFLSTLNYPFPSFPYVSSFLYSPFPSFIIHCREVYGLNEDEVSYVWKEYRDIIIDEIENNG